MLRLCRRSCNANGCGSIASFYSGLVESECDDNLGRQSASTDIRALKTMDNFQNFVIWQYHGGVLSVRGKLNRRDHPTPTDCPWCEQERKTLLGVRRCQKRGLTPNT